MEIISDTLADEKRSETELTEAVSVLAQITAPWVEDNHSVLGLTEQLTVLVSALTRKYCDSGVGKHKLQVF